MSAGGCAVARAHVVIPPFPCNHAAFHGPCIICEAIVLFSSTFTSDPCQIHVPATFSSPPNTIGLVHSHPYKAHELLTNCGTATLWNGRKAYQSYNGDTSFDDDATLRALRARYPNLLGIVIDKDHIIAYDGNPQDSQYIPRCGY